MLKPLPQPNTKALNERIKSYELINQITKIFTASLVLVLHYPCIKKAQKNIASIHKHNCALGL